MNETDPIINNSSAVSTSDVPVFSRIDHIAFAVRDLETAIGYYTKVLGFKLLKRLEIKGSRSGMISAELELGQIKFVLCQGTSPESQVSKLIDNYGPGVAHIAFEVEDVQATVSQLGSLGLAFDTRVIGGGTSLQQAFSARDSNSGMAFEFIHRDEEEGFVESNVQELFESLEKSGSY